MKFKGAKIIKYLQKIFNSFTVTALLIVFTAVAYILLLYFLKYWWILFTSTQVGQAYAEHFSYSYRITNDILNTNFINLAIKITVTSFIISLIIGSICQFLLIIRYFYSNRGLFVRIVFWGLPLVYIVAVYIRYVYDFGHMDTALTIAVVPTLCVFSGGFRLAKDYVPELVDIIFIFSGQQKKTRSKLKEEEVQRTADELIRKGDTKHSGTDWQIKLQDIWKPYADMHHSYTNYYHSQPILCSQFHKHRTSTKGRSQYPSKLLKLKHRHHHPDLMFPLLRIQILHIAVILMTKRII